MFTGACVSAWQGMETLTDDHLEPVHYNNKVETNTTKPQGPMRKNRGAEKKKGESGASRGGGGRVRQLGTACALRSPPWAPPGPRRPTRRVPATWGHATRRGPGTGVGAGPLGPSREWPAAGAARGWGPARPAPCCLLVLAWSRASRERALSAACAGSVGWEAGTRARMRVDPRGSVWVSRGSCACRQQG